MVKKNKINDNMEKTNEITFEERQYERLINARNLHYENFNKWSLYFYAIIAALFVGYYTLDAKGTPIQWCILSLGYITSLCCYLSAKGYYYWEINWIKLIMHYEKQVWPLAKENSVYSVFANKETFNKYLKILSGANISSSKLSLIVSFCVVCAWSVMITLQFVSGKCCCCIALSLLCALVVTWAISALIGWALHSDLKNHDDLELPDKEERLKK
ncbi:MAG: hypothetical protein KBT27_14825 [Prevotellaceae bacterium]|nr:hypothetical protein [Candidatus Faecinaster equi]